VRALAIAAMIVALGAPALAQTSADQEILGFRLGQSAPVLAEVHDVQSLFGPDIARDMTGLMMVEQPNPRYQIALKDGRQLTLWFDAAKQERPIYWIQLIQSYDPPPVPPDQYDRIVREFGNPDYKIDGRQGAPLAVLLIKIDPSLSDQRKLAIKQHVDAVIANRPDPSSPDDPFTELTRNIGDRFRILGDAFRGRIVAIHAHANVIDGTGTELIDTAIARGTQAQ
jgi:hypothetical protein